MKLKIAQQLELRPRLPVVVGNVDYLKSLLTVCKIGMGANYDDAEGRTTSIVVAHAHRVRGVGNIDNVKTCVQDRHVSVIA